MLVNSDFQRKPQLQPEGKQCSRPICKTCPLTDSSTTFESPTTGQTFKINFSSSCQTTNIIFLIQCSKCQVQYKGQTGNSLNMRMRSHMYDIKNDNLDNTVSRHFCLDCTTSTNRPGSSLCATLTSSNTYAMRQL